MTLQTTAAALIAYTAHQDSYPSNQSKIRDANKREKKVFSGVNVLERLIKWTTILFASPIFIT
jgi:hypothetical protein